MISRVMFYMLVLLPAIGLANDAQDLSAKQQDYQQWTRQTWDSLDKQTGSINLPEANASLNLGEDYYYLSPLRTRRRCWLRCGTTLPGSRASA